MEVLWKNEKQTSGDIAKQLKVEIGWNRNTTYTVIKKLIEKKAISREEPNFICSVMITREEAQKQETDILINKMYGGSNELFFSAFLNDKKLTKDDLDKLKKIIEELK